MSIMQQSSKAQDQTLGVWFQAIQQGQVKLLDYQGLDGEAIKTKLEADFRQFMRDRAQLVHKAVIRLAAGEQPSLDSIWAASSGGPAVEAQQEASN